MTPASPSETEEESDNVFTQEEEVEALSTTLSRRELEKSFQKFEESIRTHSEKSHYSAEDIEDEENTLEPLIITHVSDGDNPEGELREILDHMDPDAPKDYLSNELNRRVERLIKNVQEATAKADENPEARLEVTQEVKDKSVQEEAASTPEEIVRPKQRAISETPNVKIREPIANSTPMTLDPPKRNVRFRGLDEIQEEPNDTPPVELNFSRTAIEEIPIFFSIPPARGPINQYIPSTSCTSTNSSSEDDQADEQVNFLLPTLKNNVMTSRQCLTYKRDNIVHFISRDCEKVNATTKLLTEIGALNLKDIKDKKPKIGQILVTPYRSHNVFTLVVKDKHYDTLDINMIRKILKRLRDELICKNLTSFRISRRGDFTDSLEPGLLTEMLTNIFEGTPIKVVVCYGKVTLPNQNERTQIIAALHDGLIGGHKGVNQTYQKIRERYYWPGMRNEILDYIRRCPSCQEKKLERIKTREPMILTDTPIEAFDKVSIDTVGKLRTTPSGNNHLLTMQCNLTKYLIAIPIPNLRATTIADALVRHLICQFGAPRAILSDRGTSFLSDIVETMLRIFKIHHLTTSGYRPQTNGSLERSHAPLIDFIRTYSEKYNDWDRLTPFATFTYNTSVHSATNFTPFELIYGRVARFPMKIPSDEKLRTYSVYLQDLILRLEEMRTMAGENQIRSKEKAKIRYDTKIKNFTGKIGDYAWVINEPRTSKFDSYYNRPLKIVDILGRNNVILELPNGKRIRKHTDKLKAVPPTNT